MLATTKRILKSGVHGFYRNLTVSLSAILIIVISLMSFASVYFISLILGASVEQLEQKVDINVYFTMGAADEEILEMKETIKDVNQVASVEYITREQALEQFIERNQDNEVVLQTLEAIEENPLGAVFNIKAVEISQYDQVATVLDTFANSPKYGNAIDEINYYQNKSAIDKLNIIINSVQRFGVIFSVILVILSILITFNTIRLTIYSSREQIAVMRLVGASKFFARGPFLVEGILYGLIGAITTIVILWPSLYYINPYLQEIFVFDTYQYFISNLFAIGGSLILAGVALGLLSSYLAIRRYLDI